MELHRRKLPKLMACMTAASLENLRNQALFGLNTLDAKGIRRRKLPLHECLILELRESGFTESADYLQDLLYDNQQLVAEDDIGIVVDLRQREDYLEHISAGLLRAEKERDKDNTKKECEELLSLALHYSELGKGILWLAEKFFLAVIAVSSQFLLDGGRLKAVCKYYYAKFLVDKFPGADTEEPFQILTEVRDNSYGRSWPLHEPDEEGDTNRIVSGETVFKVVAIELHRLLLTNARACRKADPAKSERLSRLAERRARDANEPAKIAEAVVEIGICQLIMNNLNNAQNTLQRAHDMYTKSKNVDGLCETMMHLAAVKQKLGEHDAAAKLLTEMGALAMEHGIRKQLGRALHLLGELHLRRDKPDLGTQHLQEAFGCFMGFNWNEQTEKVTMTQKDRWSADEIDEIFTQPLQVYVDEAEQSRLMMAVSAGQELMASYFSLLREAKTCAIATIKVIEWKLSKSGWWYTRKEHDLLPCLCEKHNRTPIDILRIQLDHMNSSTNVDESGMIRRVSTITDFNVVKSSPINININI